SVSVRAARLKRVPVALGFEAVGELVLVVKRDLVVRAKVGFARVVRRIVRLRSDGGLAFLLEGHEVVGTFVEELCLSSVEEPNACWGSGALLVLTSGPSPPSSEPWRRHGSFTR